MLPVTIRSAPELGEFIPLEEYQSTTPASFSGGKPVLHAHAQGAKVWISKDQVSQLPIFSGEPAPSAAVAPGPEIETADLVERTVDIFVNSENFTVFSTEASTGISIPYPAISIHAVKQLGTSSDGVRLQAIWMQLEPSDSAQDDDEPASIDLTIIPAHAGGTQADIQTLFDAISACSDLHPDKEDDDEDDDEYDRIVFEGDLETVDGFTGVMRGREDGGMPPPFPGSSGWITAENMHEYFDADGNWIGDSAEDEEEGVSGELGEGAGRIRTRDEVNGHGTGDAPEDSENKRPRVDEPTQP
ncbi:regulator of volume decrease after cellular swelling-domain-containing protein [Plectosphaerella plurivora]|uniref:Regulator of volume decrease after cellular swelling-domain-containing protein n=1 Tax=Plectosphaerella plurivora TaxID=936078 RepID=A0A9P8VHP4_9PEZI|nr:regulator of volume decrease after cellular swelling-domain-containing protein [Plectosphaerella plurivora]